MIDNETNNLTDLAEAETCLFAALEAHNRVATREGLEDIDMLQVRQDARMIEFMFRCVREHRLALMRASND